MSQQKISLNDLAALFRQMQSRHWRDGRLHGELIVKDAAMVDVLRDLLSDSNADAYPCLVERGDPDSIHVGDVLHLGFGSPRTSVGLVVESVEALLRNREIAAGTADHSWYVFNQDVASWETSSDLPARIAAVKRLVAAFELSAALFDHRRSTLIFLRNGRFDVPISYDAKALKSMSLVAADSLSAALELDDGHSSQRREICCTAVCELLASTPLDSRFGELLNRLPELKGRFDDGYKLFAASFSFEKVRDEAEAVRIEYTAKIHKTLADIQGQLLGIPISTIVVATQFKDVSATPGQLWINIAVMVGATIFCVLLFIAILNQKHSLEVISDEVARHEDVLNRQSADLAARLGETFRKLRDRIFWHEVALAIIGLVALVALLVGFTVFWMLTRAQL